MEDESSQKVSATAAVSGAAVRPPDTEPAGSQAMSCTNFCLKLANFRPPSIYKFFCIVFILVFISSVAVFSIGLQDIEAAFNYALLFAAILYSGFMLVAAACVLLVGDTPGAPGQLAQDLEQPAHLPPQTSNTDTVTTINSFTSSKVPTAKASIKSPLLLPTGALARSGSPALSPTGAAGQPTPTSPAKTTAATERAVAASAGALPPYVPPAAPVGRVRLYAGPANEPALVSMMKKKAAAGAEPAPKMISMDPSHLTDSPVSPRRRLRAKKKHHKAKIKPKRELI